jgi:hypothetical protein
MTAFRGKVAPKIFCEVSTNQTTTKRFVSIEGKDTDIQE